MTDFLHYLFPEAGVWPGVPGTFANHQVSRLPDGTLVLTPMVPHPSFEPTSQEETPQEHTPEQTEEEA